MAITLKAARVNAGLTQEDAAKALNISRVSLQKYEGYKTSPNVDLAYKMAALYRLSVEDIIFFV